MAYFPFSLGVKNPLFAMCLSSESGKVHVFIYNKYDKSIFLVMENVDFPCFPSSSFDYFYDRKAARRRAGIGPKTRVKKRGKNVPDF